MNRFLYAAIKRFYWFIGVLIVAYWTPLPRVIRDVVGRVAESESGKSFLGTIAIFFDKHPTAVGPAVAGTGILAILLYCLKDSHFSGKPLLKVTGVTMKGIAMISAKDGSRHIVGSVYVPFENVSNGTGPEATARNLTARVMLRGRMLRGSLEYRIPIGREDHPQHEPKIDLEPAEKATVTLLIGHPLKSDTMVPATPENLEPPTVKGIGYSLLYNFSDPVYLARVRFRGIGVNQVMWFCIWNWGHENEYPNSIFGPMSIWKRTKLRLHLLGLLKKWHPYRPYRPDPNAPQFEWKLPDNLKSEDQHSKM